MQSLQCYINWLEERGQVFSVHFKHTPPSVKPNECMPAADEHTSTISVAEEEPTEAHTMLDISAPTQLLELKVNRVFILVEKMPEGAELHLLVRLLKALHLRDGEFTFGCWGKGCDPAPLLDHLDSSGCELMICFGAPLSELLLDIDFERELNESQDTAYNFKALATHSLEELASTPQLKPALWRALVKFFDFKIS